MAEGIISTGVYPLIKFIIIFADVAPNAPYGPNNKPNTYNNPIWGIIISEYLVNGNCIAYPIIIITKNDISIFFSFKFIIPLF